METNQKKHKQKAARIVDELKKKQAKYPGVNIGSVQLLKDVIRVHELMVDLICEEIDIDYCESDDPDKMCSDCNCWKSTRRSCS
jgi:hypothetical protein